MFETSDHFHRSYPDDREFPEETRPDDWKERFHHCHDRRSWWKHSHPAVKVLAVIGIIILISAFILLGGWVISLLWNWLMPAIFRLPTIDIPQALGLFVLSSILLGRGRGAKEFGREHRRKRYIRQAMDKAHEEEAEQAKSKKPGEQGG